MLIYGTMKSHLLSLAVVSIILVGCGKGDDSDQPEANTPKKSPGYSRIVNLTNSDVDLFSKNRKVCSTVHTMEASELLPIGLNEQTLRIVPTSGKEFEVKTTLEADKGVSIILMPDGKTTKLIPNELRYASSETNTHLVPVEAGGKMPSSAKIDDKSYPIKDSYINLSQGQVTFPDQTSFNVSDRIGFSLFVAATPSGVHYIMGKNASDRKPMGSGLAAN